MSLYGHNQLEPDIDGIDMDELVESFYVDEISRMSSDQIHEWCEGPEAQALLERSVLKKPTLIRLSKADDEKRRIKLTCYQLARGAKDPNWDKMIKYRAIWKKYRGLIFKKYANKATRIARIGQKKYIKSAMKEPNSKSDMLK